MRAHAAAAVAVLLLCGAHAIYVDQAGVSDWGRHGVGRVEDVVADSRHVVLRGDTGIAAGVDLRTGALVWRREFPGGACGVGRGAAAACDRAVRRALTRLVLEPHCAAQAWTRSMRMRESLRSWLSA